MRMLKKIFLFLMALLLLGAGPAIVHAKQKAEKPSDRAIMHNNKGVTALYEGGVDRALFEFKTATELSPKYVEAWNNLGLAYKFKGNMEMAVSALKTALALDVKYASAYNHLGTIYYGMGRHDDALKEFKKAIRYNKKFSDAFYNTGLTFVAMAHQANNTAKLHEAVDALTKATSYNAEHPYAHNELAKVYQELGEYEKAIIRYKLALEINPKMADSWIALSSLYNQTGQALKAQQALNHVIMETPDSPMAHLNLGLSYLNEKNYRLALKEFDLAISKMPTNEMAYFNVGYTHFQLGVEAKNSGQDATAANEFDQAIKAYESALHLKPNFVDAAYNVAYTYQTKNDVPNAIRWYQKTISLSPHYARALYNLGELYQTQGDKKNAAENFCKLLKAGNADLKIDMLRIKEQIKSWGGCP